MYLYNSGKVSTLEVSLEKVNTIDDFERIVCFINALFLSQDTVVIFKVHPSIKEQFKHIIDKNGWCQLNNYIISVSYSEFD